MADDNMEISSEHGHNAVEEDIDIDIDLTAAQADEDYILEDAQSNAGFGDEFHPQSSPTIHDDLMIDDEDNASYSMEEYSLQEHDNQDMDHEAVPMSFTEMDNSGNPADESNLADATHVDGGGSTQEAEIMWDNTEETNRNAVKAAELLEDRGENLDGVGDKPSNDTIGEVQQSTSSLNQEDHTRSPRSHHSETHSPQALSPQNRSSSPILTADLPESPSKSQIKDGTSPRLQTDLRNDIVPGDNASELGHSGPENETTLSSIQRTVVVYQSTEYALFSMSEEDDPDSFFLSDPSLSDKPISELLAAIQEVIIEELTDEEWVCMAIDDLGIEFEQNSNEAHQVTLRQIVDLRDKLLRNDGIELPDPLYIILGTTTNHPARLLRLNAAATDGKGLSELTTWDTKSESPGGAAGFEDSKYDDESHLENPQSYEETVDEVESTNGNVTTASEENLEALPQEDSKSNSGDKDEFPSASGDASTIEDPSDDKSVALKKADSDVQPSPDRSRSAHEEEDEDGDLIDYEDEEEFNHEHKTAEGYLANAATDENAAHNGTLADFVPPCYKPDTCFCSTCNALILKEYATINEELRRRSISRAAEDSSLAGQSTEDTWDANKSKGKPEDVAEVEDDLECDEEENNKYEVGQDTFNDHEDDGALLEDSGQAHHSEVQHEKHDDGFAMDSNAYEKDPAPGAEPGGDVSEQESSPVAKSTGLEIQDSNDMESAYEGFGDEFEFGDNEVEASRIPESQHDEIGTKEHSSIEDNIEKFDSAAAAKEADSAASSLGFADAADSESVTIASANTLEAEEIGYEDETEDKTLGGPAADAISYPSNDASVEAVVYGEPRDEIDYEDEVEEDVSAVQPAPTPTKKLPVPNGGSAKRPRADADPEDAAGARSKEAKRVRS